MGEREGERDFVITLVYPYPTERAQLQNENEHGEQQDQENKQTMVGTSCLLLHSTYSNASTVERRDTGMQQRAQNE